MLWYTWQSLSQPTFAVVPGGIVSSEGVAMTDEGIHDFADNHSPDVMESETSPLFPEASSLQTDIPFSEIAWDSTIADAPPSKLGKKGLIKWRNTFRNRPSFPGSLPCPIAWCDGHFHRKGLLDHL